MYWREQRRCRLLKTEQEWGDRDGKHGRESLLDLQSLIDRLFIDLV